jgi:predicted glycosyltransferase involved in capsule biosynthesis
MGIIPSSSWLKYAHLAKTPKCKANKYKSFMSSIIGEMDLLAAPNLNYFFTINGHWEWLQHLQSALIGGGDFVFRGDGVELIDWVLPSLKYCIFLVKIYR